MTAHPIIIHLSGRKAIAPNLVGKLPLNAVTKEWNRGRIDSMSGDRPIVDEVDPVEAYRLLESEPETALIDARTQAEWAFVGLPDLAALGRPVLPVEWVSFPSSAVSDSDLRVSVKPSIHSISLPFLVSDEVFFI